MPLRRRAQQYAGLAAAFVLAAGIVAVTGSPAAAHANLVGTNPANGTELDRPPEEVRLRFSERVTVAPDGITMRDRDGAAVPTEPATVAPEDPHTVVLPVPADLADGSYVVSFRVVSADSHPLAGAIVFGVGVAAGSLDGIDVATSDPVLTAVFAGARWTSYAGLALLAGGLGMFVLCWPGGWVNRRARRMVAAGAIASLAGAVAVLLLQGPYSAGRSLAGLADPDLLSATLDTDYGRYLVARLALIGAAAAVLAAGGRPRWRPVRTPAAVLVVIGLPATWVGTGHANTSDNPLDVVAEVVHLVAMLTWFGGLAMLLVCLLPRSASLPMDEVAPAVRRFSWLATVAVVALVVTGIYVAWRRVGTLEALVGTPYGRLLAFKLATIGVLLWLGSMSRSVVKRRYAGLGRPVPAEAPPAGRSRRRAARAAEEQEQVARGQLSGSVRLEAGTAIAVLAFASVLVATPPGVVVSAADTITATSAPVLDEAPLDESDPTAGVQILVDPAWVGTNRVVIEVVRQVNVVGPPDNPNEPDAQPVLETTIVPLDVPEVRASFRLPGSDLGPISVELTKIAPGVYQAGDAQLPTAGDWLLELAVRTSEIDSHTVQFAVPVS
jgi:copper transport protein